MSQESLHSYLDRADRALSRIEAALARKRERAAAAPQAAPAINDDALRMEVAKVVAELDELIGDQA